MLSRFALLTLLALPAAAQQPLLIEHGTYAVHLLEHQIGTEEYEITLAPDGLHHLTATTTVNDRGATSIVTSHLDFGPGDAPTHLEQTGALMPAALQAILLRNWLAQHRPARMNFGPRSQIEIREVGHDHYFIHGQMVRLTRYTIAHLNFGREVLWLNDSRRVAAIMTFAGGQREEILDQYAPVFDQLMQSGVTQQMLDLADLTRAVPAEASGAYAITGATLLDANTRIPNSTVLIRDGHIVAAGPSFTRIPPGTRILHAEGKWLLPGLWKLNASYAGPESGLALLAAGYTTIRDIGGEFELLTAARRALDHDHQLGPHLLLAGLIDSGGPTAYGSINIKTLADATHAVDFYAEAHFDQINLGPHIHGDFETAIRAEATRRNLPVIREEPTAKPEETLRAFTLDAARATHHEADSGTIDAGKRADLILLDADPQTDAANLHHVSKVITNGRMYSTAKLAAAVGLAH